jgi:hypothetical protein
MERRDGFIPLYIDNKQGKLLLEIPRDSMRALMFVTLATGLGSNPIGLDRGGGGDSYRRPLRSQRRPRSRRVRELELSKLRHRQPAHVRTVAEAFPPSTSGSLPIVAQEGGKLLVDATDFVMRDWNDVSGTLTASNEGSYSVGAGSVEHLSTVHQGVSGEQ